MAIESSICSPTTVHAALEYTTVTVVSTYTSSCHSASLEKLTAVAALTCTGSPDVPTADQIAVNNTSSIKTTVEHSTKIVIKTLMLTSLGYVETAECASFNIPQLFVDIHVNSACLSMTIYASLFLLTYLPYFLE